MASAQTKIMYTYTDEAPMLATHAFLPVIKAFCAHAGVDVELKDVSLAGRVIANFPEHLKEDQRMEDILTQLVKLARSETDKIIKLPHIRASIPQLKACIKELQSQGYALPEYPEDPKDETEEDVLDRYDKVLRSRGALAIPEDLPLPVIRHADQNQWFEATQSIFRTRALNRLCRERALSLWQDSIPVVINQNQLLPPNFGDSAPKLQQFTEEGHVLWDPLGEYIALVCALSELATSNPKAKVFADALDKALGRFVGVGGHDSQSRQVMRFDIRGSHYWVARYWAEEMASQTVDTSLQGVFAVAAKEMQDNEQKVLQDMIDCRGKPVDIGGYYHPDVAKVDAAMKPSETFNCIIGRLFDLKSAWAASDEHPSAIETESTQDMAYSFKPPFRVPDLPESVEYSDCNLVK
jgi:monomeric isocitrate dehydrogenase